ncbi:plasmid mobilization protein [Plectonema radiosum]
MLRVRMSDYEFEQLKQEANKQGVSMSDLVRKLISKLPKPNINAG